jgi:hypothetical protein
MIYRLAGLGNQLDDHLGQVIETADALRALAMAEMLMDANAACESVEIFAGPAFLRELRRSDLSTRFAA